MCVFCNYDIHGNEFVFPYKADTMLQQNRCFMAKQKHFISMLQAIKLKYVPIKTQKRNDIE